MKYLLIYGGCGHGHQRAAEYVAEELKNRHVGDITLIDFLWYASPLCKRLYPFLYRVTVSRLPWIWALGFYITNYKFLDFFIRWLRRIVNSLNSRGLVNFIIKEDPGIIILTHFFPAEVCTALKRHKKIKAKLVTIVTDSIPHSTWINRGTDYYIGMSEDTRQAMIAWGIDEKKINILGIPIAAKFDLQDKKEFYREKYGLDKSLFTALLTSGSFGIGPTQELVSLLNTYENKLQIMVVCGNNKQLFDVLSKRKYKVPVKIFGFVDYMDELMEAADLVIAKSGGLTMCESLAKEVPLVISKPIPGQENYNANLLLSNDAAFRIRKVNDIKGIIESVIADPGVLQVKKDNIKKIKKPHSTRDIVDFIIRLCQ